MVQALFHILETHEAGDLWQFKTSYFQIGSGVDEDDEKDDDDDDENDEDESEEEEEDGDEVTDDREKQRFNVLIRSL